MKSRSIYRSDAGQSAVMDWYDAKLHSISIPIECRHVPTHAGQTHIIATGAVDAPPLILLHGMNMNGPAMASAIVALSRIHRVYAIDIIGMPGRSAETRPSRAGTGYPRWLIDVMQQTDLTSADFIGLSFGGWLILRLAALEPARIRKAVLLDSGGLTPFTLKGQAIPGCAALRYRLRPTNANLRRAAIDPFYAEGCAPDQDVVELIGLGYRHVKFDIDPKGLPPLTKDDLASFSAPTMVLYGEKDIFFDAIRGIEYARQTIPNLAAAETISGQGHLMGVEAYVRTYARISDFLATDSH